MITCSTSYAEQLIKAAEDNGGEELLREIKGKDCVAIGLKYHKSCYLAYTRHLQRPRPSLPAEDQDDQSFINFCQVVKQRVIHQKEIMRMSKLTAMYVGEVWRTDGVDIQGYKARDLKLRLQKALPQLCFLMPTSQINEIVYVPDVPSRDPKQRVGLHETMLPSSSTVGDLSAKMPLPSCSATEELVDGQQKECARGGIDTSSQSMFASAQALRTAIESLTLDAVPWPSAAEQHPTEHLAMDLVPIQLYNFLSWVVGASCDPQDAKSVDVADPKLRRQIFNICQDVVKVSSKRRKRLNKEERKKRKRVRKEGKANDQVVI